MPTQHDVTTLLPSHLKGRVPSSEQIHRALGRQQYSYSVDTTFVRAVSNREFVGSASPYAAHRFGPPVPQFLTSDNKLAFNWLYLGLSPLVAAWESQFVKNNRGAGNGYHITRSAVNHGLIASLRFRRPLKLWSLSDENSSRLGIHDIVSSADHEACQWLGCAIRGAMLMLDPESCPDGFAYPSRRVKGAPALALADWCTSGLFSVADVSVTRFVDTETYASLAQDPMRTEPPELDARLQ